MTTAPTATERAIELSDKVSKSLTQRFYALIKRTENNVRRLPMDVLSMNVTGDAEQEGEFVELAFDEEGEEMSEFLLGMSMQLVAIKQDLNQPKVVSNKALGERFERVYMDALVVSSKLHSQHRAVNAMVARLPKNQQDLLGLRLMVDVRRDSFLPFREPHQLTSALQKQLNNLKIAGEAIKMELFALTKVRDLLPPPAPATTGPDGLQFSGMSLDGRVLSREDVMEQLMGLE